MFYVVAVLLFWAMSGSVNIVCEAGTNPLAIGKDYFKVFCLGPIYTMKFVWKLFF